MEQYFLRALKESNGDIMVLFSSTLGNVLWVALIISLFMPTILAKWRARGARESGRVGRLGAARMASALPANRADQPVYSRICMPAPQRSIR